MSISVACPCGKRFAARDELAGKRVKCPGCQQPITIPATDSAANGSRPARDDQAAEKRPTASHDNDKVAANQVAVGVRCPCGRIVKASQKLLGKRVKCPGCGQPLAIPAAATGQTASGKKTAPRKRAPASGPHSAEAATVMGALFDEIGFGTSITKSRCPACKFDLDPEAVLCVKCGYHMETGKQLRTKVIKRKRF